MASTGDVTGIFFFHCTDSTFTSPVILSNGKWQCLVLLHGGIAYDWRYMELVKCQDIPRTQQKQTCKWVTQLPNVELFLSWWSHQRSRRKNYCGRLAIRTVTLDNLEMNFKEHLFSNESVSIYIYLINFTVAIQRSISLYLWLSLFFSYPSDNYWCYTSHNVIFFFFQIPSVWKSWFQPKEKHLGTLQKKLATISVALSWLGILKAVQTFQSR